jgi:hypothetical protein
LISQGDLPCGRHCASTPSGTFFKAGCYKRASSFPKIKFRVAIAAGEAAPLRSPVSPQKTGHSSNNSRSSMAVHNGCGARHRSASVSQTEHDTRKTHKTLGVRRVPVFRKALFDRSAGVATPGLTPGLVVFGVRDGRLDSVISIRAYMLRNPMSKE